MNINFFIFHYYNDYQYNLKNSSDNSYLCLISDFKKQTIQHSINLLSILCTCFADVLFRLRKFSSISSLLKLSFTNVCLILSNLFGFLMR